jgi:hypothetical protein
MKKDKGNLDQIVEVHNYDSQKYWISMVNPATQFIKKKCSESEH